MQNTFVLDTETGALQVSRNGLVVMTLSPNEQLELLALIASAHVQLFKQHAAPQPLEVVRPILDPTKG